MILLQKDLTAQQGDGSSRTGVWADQRGREREVPTGFRLDKEDRDRLRPSPVGPG